MARKGFIDSQRLRGFSLRGAVARSGIPLTINDRGTPSSGASQGIYISYNQMGAKTGSAQVSPLGIRLAITEAVPYGYGISLYTAPVANKVVGNLHALDVYMDDPGTQCGRFYSVNLGQVHTNPATESGFIRMRNHGASPLNAIFRIEANNPATHLLRLGAGSPYHSSNVSVEDGRISIDYNGATKYLKVYAS